MRAVVLSAFGQTPEVVELELPQPEAGEVRVRVHAASVNGFDLAVTKGFLEGALEHRFPVILGKDFAGVVDALGPGVDGFEIGERVFGVVTKPFLGDGSFAEYVTVPVTVGLARIPDGVTFSDAAALGLAGTAAFDSVAAAKLGAGDTVLIAGATGGVGTHAIQLAVQTGARVIATAATADEVERVTELGAFATVDYRRDVSAQVRELAHDGVDAILHFAGDAEALASALTPSGRLVSTILQSPDQIAAEGVTVLPVYAVPSQDTLDRLARSHAEETTKVTVEATYDLDKTLDAFERFTSGTLGKVLITIPA